MMDVLDLRLSPSQSELFAETLRVQREHKLSVIYSIVTDSYMPEEGRSVIRLESKLCSRKTAAKIARLIREDCLDTTKIETG
jgi:hypothetical protein